MHKLFMIIGLIAFFMGLLWIGQGLGYIRWPTGSFMINQTNWAYYGAILAVIGVLVTWFSRY